MNREIKFRAFATKNGEMRIYKTNERYRKTKKGIVTNMFSHIKDRSKKYKREVSFNSYQLYKWCMAKPEFHIIFKKWLENGYKKEDKPSIDRIDPYGGYTFCNIQILTCKQNLVKGYTEVAAKKHKPITQKTLSGSIVAKYNSIKEAAKVSGISQGLISNVLIGKRKHTHGFIFSYTNNIHQNPELLK